MVKGTQGDEEKDATYTHNYPSDISREQYALIKEEQEYARNTLSAEKKKLYSEYHPVRKFMQEILTAKQNAEQLLIYRSTSKENERD